MREGVTQVATWRLPGIWSAPAWRQSSTSSSSPWSSSSSSSWSSSSSSSILMAAEESKASFEGSHYRIFSFTDANWALHYLIIIIIIWLLSLLFSSLTDAIQRQEYWVWKSAKKRTISQYHNINIVQYHKECKAQCVEAEISR